MQKDELHETSKELQAPKLYKPAKLGTLSGREVETYQSEFGPGGNAVCVLFGVG